MVQIGVEREGFRPSYRPAKAAGFDPDMKRMGMIAAGIFGVVVLGVGAVSLMGARHHGVPVIEAQAGPVRMKPADAGGMQVTGADLGLGIGTTQTLAPVAEQPQINALRAQLHAVKKELARQAAETAQVAKLAEARASKIVAAPPVQRASATARISQPLPLAALSPAVVSFNPVVLSPPAAVRVPASRLAVSGPAVQLAAFTDEAAAKTGWDSLVRKAPDLLGGRGAEITKVQASGRTMWRLRTAGFGTVAEAGNFCAKMRAHGADCAIAAF
jgi:hypothetical protein